MFEKLNEKNKKKPGTWAKIFATHPQSIDRRDASLSLVARFPEKEEYVISSSEFNRVKTHLMRMTNAKAGILSDPNDGDPGRPTLKRRQPEDPGDPNIGNTDGESSSKPPTLRRRDQAPEPSPSPSPEN